MKKASTKRGFSKVLEVGGFGGPAGGNLGKSRGGTEHKKTEGGIQ